MGYQNNLKNCKEFYRNGTAPTGFEIPGSALMLSLQTVSVQPLFINGLVHGLHTRVYPIQMNKLKNVQCNRLLILTTLWREIP